MENNSATIVKWLMLQFVHRESALRFSTEASLLALHLNN